MMFPTMRQLKSCTKKKNDGNSECGQTIGNKKLGDYMVIIFVF